MMETLIDKCPRVETERLVLRRWEERDLDGVIRMNGDPRVMEFFRSLNTPDEARQFLDIMMRQEEKHGFCFPVVEDKRLVPFSVFVGSMFQRTVGLCHVSPVLRLVGGLPLRHGERALLLKRPGSGLDLDSKCFSLMKLLPSQSSKIINLGG